MRLDWFHWAAVLMGVFLAGVTCLVAFSQLLTYSPARPRIAVNTGMVGITGQIRAAHVDGNQIEFRCAPASPAIF